jgi:hypothetical protein
MVEEGGVRIFPNDVQMQFEGVVGKTHVSHTNFPADHHSHDMNFNLRLDPSYHGTCLRE